jgi:hypothetical protein
MPGIALAGAREVNHPAPRILRMGDGLDQALVF